MVRVFPKSANQPNKMALTICTSISADERLETGKFSKWFPPFVPNEKRGVPLKVLHNFRTEFPENYLTI